MNPKRLVSDGYDRIHLAYASWGDQDGLRQRYIGEVFDRGLVAAGGLALDLGCGTGALATAALDRWLTVVGVDISGQSVRAARAQVPGGRYVVADMANVEFAPMSFDLITAFYSLIHVPRDEHASVLASITRWLRAGGIAVLTMSAGNGGEGVSENWLGAPMYWSNWDRDTNIRMVRASGLQGLEARDEETKEDDHLVPFLWVIGRR